VVLAITGVVGEGEATCENGRNPYWVSFSLSHSFSVATAASLRSASRASKSSYKVKQTKEHGTST
jgi:hypothetical protein